MLLMKMSYFGSLLNYEGILLISMFGCRWGNTIRFVFSLEKKFIEKIGTKCDIENLCVGNDDLKIRWIISSMCKRDWEYVRKITQKDEIVEIVS